MLPPPRFELGTSRLLSVRSDQLSYGGTHVLGYNLWASKEFIGSENRQSLCGWQGSGKAMGAGASLPSRKRKQQRLPKYADVEDDYIGPRQLVLGNVCSPIRVFMSVCICFHYTPPCARVPNLCNCYVLA